MTDIQNIHTEPRGKLTLRTLAMPADTNPSGDIFGGWVISQMDIASAICAIERAGSRVVTVALDRMSFIRPVNVGDVLCVYAEVDRVGRTSITVHVEAWVRRNHQKDHLQVTHGTFIFVALNEAGKPTPVPEQVRC